MGVTNSMMGSERARLANGRGALVAPWLPKEPVANVGVAEGVLACLGDGKRPLIVLCGGSPTCHGRLCWRADRRLEQRLVPSSAHTPMRWAIASSSCQSNELVDKDVRIISAMAFSWCVA